MLDIVDDILVARDETAERGEALHHDRDDVLGLRRARRLNRNSLKLLKR